MEISIIVPVYNEVKSLEILDRDISRELDGGTIAYEIIYVDDGSIDGSAAVLENIVKRNPRARVLFLARNYGQTQAIAAGIDHAHGEILVTMDADLQNDPADIPLLAAKLREGYDVVSGWRARRRDNWLWKKFPSYIANLLCARLTGINIHDFGCTLKAYRREVFEGMQFYGEIHRFFPVCAAMQGAKITEIPVRHYRRRFGRSKYGLSRVFKVILDMIALMFMWKFAAKPMYVFGGIGLGALTIALVTAVFIALRKFFWGGVWVSPLLFLFVLFSIMGIQFILMGILAELIMRQRPGAAPRKRYCLKERRAEKT